MVLEAGACGRVVNDGAGSAVGGVALGAAGDGVGCGVTAVGLGGAVVGMRCWDCVGTAGVVGCVVDGWAFPVPVALMSTAEATIAAAVVLLNRLIVALHGLGLTLCRYIAPSLK